MTVDRLENQDRPVLRHKLRPRHHYASAPWAAPPAGEHSRVLPWQACAKCGVYRFPDEAGPCGACAGGWTCWQVKP